MQDAAASSPQQLGPFEIAGVLGRGGSGVVYRARRQGAWFALKVLAAEGSITAKERGRFLREARLLSKIEHSHLVRVHDCGEFDDGTPFIAMELLEGIDLEQELAKGAMPVPRALSLFAQLASAVAALHQADLLHRDLKPQNVMLVDGGKRVVLLDLGIARETGAPPSTTTEAGMQRGTPAYMAPERLFGASASRSSDIYELGLILYLMVVGAVPWKDASDALARLSPASAGDLLPPGLREPVLRALDADPDARPRDVDALLAALGRAESGRRPLSRALMIPIGLAAFASVTGVLLWQLSQPGAQPAQTAASFDAGLALAVLDAAANPAAPDAQAASQVAVITTDAAVSRAVVRGPVDARRRRPRRGPRKAVEPALSSPVDASSVVVPRTVVVPKVPFPWPHRQCRKLARAYCDRDLPTFKVDTCDFYTELVRDWRNNRQATVHTRRAIEKICAKDLAKLLK